MDERLGLWIVFEGSDACGKSTVMNGVYQCLSQLINTNSILVTREPGSAHTLVTSKIRTMLKATDNEQPTEIAETMLFLADRAHHYHSVIRPNLCQNKLVLQDRSYLSTVVYQVGLRQFPRELLDLIHGLIMRPRRPDMIFWVDTPLSITVHRMKGKRADDIDTFNVESMQKIVYEGYRHLYTDTNPGIPPIHRLDGTKTVDELVQTACSIIEPAYKIRVTPPI